MIQFNTLNYLFMAMFTLELNKHVLILYLLRTSESLCITVKILNIGRDVEVN